MSTVPTSGISVEASLLAPLLLMLTSVVERAITGRRRAHTDTGSARQRRPQRRRCGAWAAESVRARLCGRPLDRSPTKDAVLWVQPTLFSSGRGSQGSARTPRVVRRRTTDRAQRHDWLGAVDRVRARDVDRRVRRAGKTAASHRRTGSPLHAFRHRDVESPQRLSTAIAFSRRRPSDLPVAVIFSPRWLPSDLPRAPSERSRSRRARPERRWRAGDGALRADAAVTSRPQRAAWARRWRRWLVVRSRRLASVAQRRHAVEERHRGRWAPGLAGRSRSAERSRPCSGPTAAAR